MGQLIQCDQVPTHIMVTYVRKGGLMAKLTPVEYTEKHARRLTASVEDVRRGIDRVTESPMEKAAAKKDKMLANLTASVNDGRWERGLKRVSLEDWKTKTRDVGVGRIAAGIQAASAKVTAFAEELLPHIDAGQAKLKAMPDITLEDNIARMTSFVRHMASMKRTK